MNQQTNIVFKSMALIAFTLLTIKVSAQKEFDNIYLALKSGNSTALSVYFDSQIELTIKGGPVKAQNSYSKVQAKNILADFFSKAIPTAFSAKHQGEANDWLKYKIGFLDTESGRYRVLIRVKQTDDVFLIQELEIIKIDKN